MGASRLQDMLLMIIPISFLSIFGTTEKDRNFPSRLTKKDVYKNLFTFWVLALIVITMFHYPYLTKDRYIQYTENIAHFWHQGVTDNFRGFLTSSLVISIIFLGQTLSEVGLFISLIGLIYIAKNFPRIFIFFLLWICIPLLFYGSLYSIVPRFFTFILPPFIIALNYLLIRFMNLNSLFRSIFIAVYSIILYLTFTSIFPYLYIRHNYAFLPDHAQWAAEKIENNARLITTDDSTFYNYYGHINTLGRPMHFLHLNDKELEIFKKELDNLLEHNIPIYTTSVGLFSYNPDNKFSALMKDNYALEVIGTKLYESWHRDVLKQRLIQNQLIRIKKKNPDPI
jgi:hypothetical protein